MSFEFHQKLKNTYTDLFSDHCSIECNDGWYNILDSWCKLVTAENNRSRNNHLKNIDHYKNDTFICIKPVQIKEKWGTLRIYTNYRNDFVNGVTCMAEELSLRTCELCGNYGIIRDMSWIKVLCDQHYVAESLGAPAAFMGEDKCQN